jgi:hypothetical protein
LYLASIFLTGCSELQRPQLDFGNVNALQLGHNDNMQREWDFDNMDDDLQPPPSPRIRHPHNLDQHAFDNNADRLRLFTQFLDTDSEVPDVRLAQQYIRDLRTSTLETSAMTPAQVHRLRNPLRQPATLNAPDEGNNRDLALELGMYVSATECSQETFNDMMDVIRRDDPTRNLHDYAAVRDKAAELTGIYSIEADFCVKSCMAFTGPYSHLDDCLKCGEPRREAGQRRSYMVTFPLGPQIQALHRSERTSELLDYWPRLAESVLQKMHLGESLDDLVRSDIALGNDMLSMLRFGKLGPDDTIVLLTLDAAQLQGNKESSSYMWVYILLNFAPDGRYKMKRVLPAGVTPGPKSASTMESVLYHTMQHIVAVNSDGGLRIWDAYRNTETYHEMCIAEGREPRPAEYISDIFIVMFCADAMALPHMSGGVGPSGKHGCRIFCPTPGRLFGQNYYPAMAKPANYDILGSNHPDQSYHNPPKPDPAHYFEALNRLCKADARRYTDLRKETGIVKPAIVLGLWSEHSTSPMTLDPPKCFGMDIMHAVANIARHIIDLWRGRLDCYEPDSRDQWPFFSIDDDMWQLHGIDVERCNTATPSKWARYCRNPAKFINTGYKTIEFLHWFFIFGPVLFYGMLPTAIWRHYCKLVQGFRIIYQYNIAPDEVNKARELLSEFIAEFERIYMDRNPARLHFATQVMHNIVHFADEVDRIGPLSLYAQWTLERAIGFNKSHMRQPSRLYQNLFHVCLELAQTNALKGMWPELERRRDRTTIPQHAIDLGDGYVLKPKTSEAQTLPTPYEHALLHRLLDELRMSGQDVNINGEKVIRYGNLLLPEGLTVRSVWVHESLRRQDKRDSTNAKVSKCRREENTAQLVYFAGAYTRAHGLCASSVFLRVECQPHPRSLCSD